MPLLGPFSFLCHQKWDSASKIPLIPRDIPILMLSGVKDELIPREHMQELWEIICKRQGSQVAQQEERKQEQQEQGSVPLEQIGKGRSRFTEFPAGTHSAYPFCCDDHHCNIELSDDTCVQHGYWTEVTKFMATIEQL